MTATTLVFPKIPKEFSDLFRFLIKTEEYYDGQSHFLFVSASVDLQLVETLARHLRGSYSNHLKVSVCEIILSKVDVEEMINYFEKPSVDFLCGCLEGVGS